MAKNAPTPPRKTIKINESENSPDALEEITSSINFSKLDRNPVRFPRYREPTVEEMVRCIASVKPSQKSGNGDDPTKTAAHSDDFRSINWYGTLYTFTTTQAACIEVLWRNWKRGTPVIGEVALLDAAGSNGSKLRDVFEKGHHPAWGTLIISENKGAFRLTDK